MKKYLTPEIVLIVLQNDIVTSSSGTPDYETPAVPFSHGISSADLWSE